MNEAVIAGARIARERGESYRSIAKRIGVHESTVRRALKKTAPVKKRRITILVFEEEI